MSADFGGLFYLKKLCQSITNYHIIITVTVTIAIAIAITSIDIQFICFGRCLRRCLRRRFLPSSRLEFLVCGCGGMLSSSSRRRRRFNIGPVLHEHLERDDIRSSRVSALGNHQRSLTGLLRLQPARRAETPAAIIESSAQHTSIVCWIRPQEEDKARTQGEGGHISPTSSPNAWSARCVKDVPRTCQPALRPFDSALEKLTSLATSSPAFSLWGMGHPPPSREPCDSVVIDSS